MKIDFSQAGEIIRSCEDVYILCHQNPDGDTLGSGFALWNALKDMGKRAKVLCSDGFPKRYNFLYEGYTAEEFEPKTIIAVDLADTTLFGDKLKEYADKVDLCIDHHHTNKDYAKNLLLLPNAPAACEVMYKLFKACGIPLSDIIAKCLYTGIATDTGCFKFESTTSETHIITADLMNYKIDYALVNRLMFDIKTRERLIIEGEVLSDMAVILDGKCAMIAITSEMINRTGIEQAGYDGIASLPLQVEGVEVGVTIKQRDENAFKISMRSASYADVSAICQTFGGGGHVRAAGCLIHGTLEEVKSAIAKAVKEYL